MPLFPCAGSQGIASRPQLNDLKIMARLQVRVRATKWSTKWKSHFDNQVVELNEELFGLKHLIFIFSQEGIENFLFRARGEQEGMIFLMVSTAEPHQ